MSEYQFKDEREVSFWWNSSGMLPSAEKRVAIKDAISTPNVSPWLPKVMENIVKEAAEPLLVGTQLLQRIEFKFGQVITFPATGALDAADIPEGGSYPERSLGQGGATVTASVGKSGVAVKITEEMIRYSQFDVINMHLRAAGRGLARHKEKKIFNFIRSMGIPVYDNLNPTASSLGVTHGRALDGSANGSAIADDIFDAYVQVMYNGFIPRVMLVHPLTWGMFVKDPILRYLALQGGGGTMFASYTGQPSGRAPWDNSNQGKQGVSAGQDINPAGGLNGAGSGGAASSLLSYPQDLTSAPKLPGYFPFPLTVIVSPFVPFNTSTRLTDIYIFDPAELGGLVVDEDVTMDEWTDPSTDIHKVKLRERYGIVIFNEGKGIATLKNVKIVPNEIVFPAQATIDVSGSIAAINPSTPVV